MKIKNYRLIKLILILIILAFLQCVKFTTDSKTTTNSKIKNLLTSNLLSKSQTISSSNLLKTNLSNLSHEKTTSTLNLTTKHCNSLCAQCSLNDFNYCTLCQSGMIFYNFNCYATCPDGTFLQESTRKCLPCSENCPICWGSESSMCGTVYGVFTQVVELEKEVIEYFSTHIFVKEEIDEWLNNLKIIFANKIDEIIYPLFVEDNPLISVYLNDKISAELPIGTFGLSNGIFIPIPPYINKDKKLIESHWVYKQGMFDGITWHSDYFPRLPSFIKYKGTKDKIYVENNGYWVYDLVKQWIFINSNKIVQVDISIPEKLGRLNNIKFDVKYFFII